MRNTSALQPMKSIFLPGLALLLSLTSTTLAQENQKPAQPLGDDSEFRALHNPVISADGAWMAAEERPDRGDGNVRVWSTEGDVTFTIERGQNPRISRDSRWVSALQKPPLEDSRTAKPKNKRAGQTLVLLDTQDGSRRTFDFVLSYDMTYSSTYLLYLQSPETKADEEGPSKDEATKPATKPAARERKVGTLHLVHLKGDNGCSRWRTSHNTPLIRQPITSPMCCTTKRQVAIHSTSPGSPRELGHQRDVRRREDRRSVLGARSLSRSGSSTARRQQAKTGSGA